MVLIAKSNNRIKLLNKMFGYPASEAAAVAEKIKLNEKYYTEESETYDVPSNLFKDAEREGAIPVSMSTLNKLYYMFYFESSKGLIFRNRITGENYLFVFTDRDALAENVLIVTVNDKRERFDALEKLPQLDYNNFYLHKKTER